MYRLIYVGFPNLRTCNMIYSFIICGVGTARCRAVCLSWLCAEKGVRYAYLENFPCPGGFWWQVFWRISAYIHL